MAGNIGRLIKIQLLDVTGWNHLRYSLKGGQKLKSLLGFTALLLAGGIFAFYSVMLAKFCIDNHMGEAVLPLMYTGAAIATLITGILKTSGLIFGARDYEMLQALPIHEGAVIFSRFTTLYLLNAGFSLCMLFPAGILYGMDQGAGFLYYVGLIAVVILVPVVPMVLATVLGTLLLAVSTRFRYKNLVMILLGLAAVSATLLFSFSMQGKEVDAQSMSSVTGLLLDMMYQVFPLSRMIHLGLCRGSLVWMGGFMAVSIGTALVFLWIMSKIYKRLNTAVTTQRQQADYRLTQLKGQAPILALYKKELRRYFASAVYVLNTAVGPLLMLILSAAVLAGYGEQLLNIPGIQGIFGLVLPFLLGFAASMNATAASSISMEGSSYWQLLVLPVKPSTILNSKRLVNFTLAVPAIVLSGIFICIKTRPEPLTGIWLFLIPLAYTWLTAEAGLFMNLKVPNFHWKTETAVVKQSLPMFLTVVICLVASGIPIFLMSQLPSSKLGMVAPLFFCIALVICLVLHVLSNRVKLNTLEG